MQESRKLDYERTVMALALLGATACAETSGASEADPCQHLLVPTLEVFRADVSTRTVYLSTIDQETFDQIKKSSSFSLKAGLLDLLNLGLNSTSDEFNDARSRYFHQVGYDASYTDQSSYLARYVPKAALDAYVVCRKDDADHREGVHIWPEDVAENDFVVGIQWHPHPSPRVHSTKITYELRGVGNKEHALSHLFANATSRFVLTRLPGQDQRVLARASDDQSADDFQISRPKLNPVTNRSWCLRQTPVPLVVTGFLGGGTGERTGPEDGWVGTSGQSRRSETWKIDFDRRYPLDPLPQLGLQYRCHVSNFGWTEWVKQGDDCFPAKNQSVEAIQIDVTGNDAPNFSLSYACHLADLGDVGPVQKGASCGTERQSRRLEALRVILVSRGICP